MYHFSKNDNQRLLIIAIYGGKVSIKKNYILRIGIQRIFLFRIISEHFNVGKLHKLRALWYNFLLLFQV